MAWQVLEEEEYLRRKVFYQAIGQRHYYFMNVGNGEVIDACRKVGICLLPQNADQQCASASTHPQEHLACSTCSGRGDLRDKIFKFIGFGMGRLTDLSAPREWRMSGYHGGR